MAAVSPVCGRSKGLPKTGGRRKRVRTKITVALKGAILAAGEAAGGDAGITGYLTEQAAANPTAFLGLLGKVSPLTLAGDASEPTHLTFSWLPVTDRSGAPVV